MAVDAGRRRPRPAASRPTGRWSLARSTSAPAEVQVDLTRPAATPAPRSPTGRRPAAPARATTTSTVWTALGLATTCADLVGTMQGARRPRRRLRRRAPAVRPGRRLVPGGAAPARRRPRRSPRAPAAPPSTRRGPSTRSPPAEAVAAGRRGQGVRRPGRARRVRDRDPGARRHRQHVGVPRPRLPAAGAAVDRVFGGVDASLARVLGAPRHRSRRWTSVTRPDEAAFRARLPRLARGQQPGARRVVDRPTTTGHGQAAWHHVSLRRRLLRHVVADGHRRPGAAHRLRDDRRRRAGRRRRPAAPEPRLPRAGHPRARQRRHPPALPPRHRQRPRPVVPGLQRAGRRLRPRVAAHTRRPRRRRVRHHRPQGLDELLRRRRLVPRAGPHRPRRAEAQGHLGVRRADGPARRRAAAAEDDQRRHHGVRRGALRRGAGAGRRT